MKSQKNTADELAEVKRKLADKEVVFDNILEGTLAGYWDWNIPENTEYLSPTFKAMFGYEDHEMENSPESWQKIIHPDDLPGVFDVFHAHVQSHGKVPYNSEVRYFHKDGSIVWVYCRGKVIEWDEEGNAVRMVGSHVDITKLKQAEDTEKYAKLLEKKNRELQQFAYVASHDLQEPLRTIKSYAEILEEDYQGQLGGEIDTYLHFIKQGATRMSRLVKDLLDYSRLGSEPEKTQVDCNAVLQSVKEDLQKVIDDTEGKIDAEHLPEVIGRETELRLLLQNLLSNALKFRKADTPPHIRITCEKEGSMHKFCVADNGIGIPQEYQKRVFILFKRLHDDRKYQGTGIGLAHCQKIVEGHGGEIWLESKTGKGTEVYFTLPAATKSKEG